MLALETQLRHGLTGSGKSTPCDSSASGMYDFCTYFDSNYLVRGLALYRSLVRHAGEFRLWVLCLHHQAYEILRRLALQGVHPITLEAFEEEDEELARAKGNRSRIEYYFTCTPCLPLHVLRNHPEVEVVTYLDADLFFFSHPGPIYEELEGHSVLIVGHRFPPHLRDRERHGKYNVGLVSFRGDEEGLRCLAWWRERCLEWCYDRVEDGRFADQKYLDDWPTRFARVAVLQHPGAGLAPWNVDNYALSRVTTDVFVDRKPLVFFHFHGLRHVEGWLYDPDLDCYGVRCGRAIKRPIYGPYLKELHGAARQLASVSPASESEVRNGSIRYGVPQASQPVSLARQLVRRVRRRWGHAREVCRGRLWMVVNGRVI